MTKNEKEKAEDKPDVSKEAGKAKKDDSNEEVG